MDRPDQEPAAPPGPAPEVIVWPDDMDAARFVGEFWQRQPLLIRQALPGFRSPLSADELAGLALEPDTTPRLVIRDEQGQYHLEHGPFEPDRFASLGDSDWSLLVTDVEKHLPELAAWLAPFRFLPAWRLDDLMISYAPAGASVGAHVDEYDVFLLQASGQRRREIQTTEAGADTTASDAPPKPAALNGHAPGQLNGTAPDENGAPESEANSDDEALRLLADFRPDQSWLLEPGDLLYLPPGVPHHGTAVDNDCMTWSIGFRAPAQRDIVEEFSALLAESLRHQRFEDPPFDPLTGADAAEISTATVLRFAELWADAVRLEPAQLNNFVGRLVTANPARVDSPVDAPQPALAEATWVRHSFSRFAYMQCGSGECIEEARLFVDGEAYDCSLSLARQLCDPGQPVLPSELPPGSRDRQLLDELARRGRIEPLAD